MIRITVSERCAKCGAWYVETYENKDPGASLLDMGEHHLWYTLNELGRHRQVEVATHQSSYVIRLCDACLANCEAMTIWEVKDLAWTETKFAPWFVAEQEAAKDKEVSDVAQDA